MKGLENQQFLLAYTISNIIAIILLVIAWRRPIIARILFSLLFAWACFMNWSISSMSSDVYLEYADLTVFKGYRDFITGWFHLHIKLFVGFVATVQGLIAVFLTLKGLLYKIGIIAAVIFLLAIAPLGVGSAFPCTINLAIALGFLWKQNTYLWLPSSRQYGFHL